MVNDFISNILYYHKKTDFKNGKMIKFVGLNPLLCSSEGTLYLLTINEDPLWASVSHQLAQICQ